MTPVRVLIVAETKVYRALLANARARVPDLEVAGTSATCAEALERIATERFNEIVSQGVMPTCSQSTDRSG